MPKLSETHYPRPAKAVEVAPDVYVIPAEISRLPRVAIFELIMEKDGRLKPQYRLNDALMRVTEVAALPLGISEEVILKLIKGGFVASAQPGPNNRMVDVHDLLAHIDETKADLHYWTDERRARYRDGLIE